MSFSHIVTGGSATYGSNATLATLTFSPVGGTLPAGSLVVLGWCANVAALTVSTCADNSTQAGAANVWDISRTPEAGATLTGGIITCYTTRDILSTDVITVTLSATASRRAGSLQAWTPSNANPVLDKTGNVSNAVASPVTCSATGALSQTDDMAVQLDFWKGGAVGSGWAHSSPSGFTSGTAGLSGGTVTRVETSIAWRDNLGSNATFSAASTYTSITAGASEVLTFTDQPLPPAAFAPIAAQDRMTTADMAPRYAPGGSRVVGIFDNPTVPATAFVQSVLPAARAPAYRGSPSSVFAAADERLDLALIAPAANPPRPFYAGPRSQVVNVFTPNPIPPDTRNLIAMSRAVALYSAPAAHIVNVFDPLYNTFADWAPGALKPRPTPYYAAPEAIVALAFDNTPLGGLQFVPAALTRASSFYRGSYSAVFAAADEALSDPWAQVYASRALPPGARALSQAIAVYSPNVAALDTWAPFVSERGAVLYLPPRPQAISVFATAVAPDAIAWVAQSRYAPARGAQGSLTILPDGAPDAYAPLALSPTRIPFYAASRSSVSSLADNPPAQGYVPVAQSRGSLARAAVVSTAIMPPSEGIVIVTPANTGGGGEWVIWEKPNFPGNRPGAWPSFNRPAFRRPSRNERRGY